MILQGIIEMKNVMYVITSKALSELVASSGTSGTTGETGTTGMIGGEVVIHDPLAFGSVPFGQVRQDTAVQVEHPKAGGQAWQTLTFKRYPTLHDVQWDLSLHKTQLGMSVEQGMQLPASRVYPGLQVVHTHTPPTLVAA